MLNNITVRFQQTSQTYSTSMSTTLLGVWPWIMSNTPLNFRRNPHCLSRSAGSTPGGVFGSILLVTTRRGGAPQCHRSHASYNFTLPGGNYTTIHPAPTMHHQTPPYTTLPTVHTLHHHAFVSHSYLTGNVQEGLIRMMLVQADG